MNIINKRIRLEKKYTDKCLFMKLPLLQNGKNILAISPGSYFYHTGKRAKMKDVIEYKKLSSKAHFGERLELENKVNEILKTSIFEKKYFFEVKNIICNSSFEELNKMLLSKRVKTLKKYEYNQLIKLLKKWGLKSINYHFIIKGAKRRLHIKFLKEKEMKKDTVLKKLYSVFSEVNEDLNLEDGELKQNQKFIEDWGSEDTIDEFFARINKIFGTDFSINDCDNFNDLAEMILEEVE